MVGVALGVSVGVCVGRRVGVGVRTAVAEAVTDAVAVGDGAVVDEGCGVGVMLARAPGSCGCFVFVTPAPESAT
jgi:hypothetical protein